MEFTIVIPTRERADTLYHTIRSVLCQTYPNFELVVMDNASADDTGEVVAGFRDPRIRYVRSPERLSMADNWELGLSHATGDYVFILGDDDALLPDGLAICRALIQQHRPQIVSWVRYFYGWPSAIAERARNRLFLHLTQDIVVQDGKQLLRQFYQSKASFEVLPMIYNSFVHRDLIERIRRIKGRYFCLPVPDVYSGVINAYYTGNYLFLHRSLSLSGSSGHSIGASGLDADKQPAAFKKFLAETKFWNVHPALQADPAELREEMLSMTEFAIGETMFSAKDLMFREDESIQVDILELLKSIAGALARYPESYARRRQYLVNLGRRYNINVDLPEAPPLLTVERPQGPMRDASGQISSMVVNCQRAGVSNAADAARLASAMLPDVRTD